MIERSSTVKDHIARSPIHAKYIAWGRDNPHVVQVSMCASGRNWLMRMMKIGYGIPIACAVSSTSLSDIILATYVLDHASELRDLHKDTKYIILIRDPRDVVLSRFRTQQLRENWVISPGQTMDDFWSSFELSTQLALWSSYLSPQCFTQVPCENHLIIQYERLCLNPATELTRMGRFLGISALYELDAIVEKTNLVDFKTGLERYNMQCLKYQRDDIFSERYNKVTLDTIGEEMNRWGYFLEGHGDSILAAL